MCFLKKLPSVVYPLHACFKRSILLASVDCDSIRAKSFELHKTFARMRTDELSAAYDVNPRHVLCLRNANVMLPLSSATHLFSPLCVRVAIMAENPRRNCHPFPSASSTRLPMGTRLTSPLHTTYFRFTPFCFPKMSPILSSGRKRMQPRPKFCVRFAYVLCPSASGTGPLGSFMSLALVSPQMSKKVVNKMNT